MCLEKSLSLCLHCGAPRWWAKTHFGRIEKEQRLLGSGQTWGAIPTISRLQLAPCSWYKWSAGSFPHVPWVFMVGSLRQDSKGWGSHRPFPQEALYVFLDSGPQPANILWCWLSLSPPSPMSPACCGWSILEAKVRWVQLFLMPPDAPSIWTVRKWSFTVFLLHILPSPLPWWFSSLFYMCSSITHWRVLACNRSWFPVSSQPLMCCVTLDKALRLSVPVSLSVKERCFPSSLPGTLFWDSEYCAVACSQMSTFLLAQSCWRHPELSASGQLHTQALSFAQRMGGRLEGHPLGGDLAATRNIFPQASAWVQFLKPALKHLYQVSYS